MSDKYEKTVTLCFVGYCVQAIINNFIPLLFVTFQNDYQIPLSQVTMTVTVNFGIQLAVDLLSVKLIDKIGYRISMIAGHVFAAAGLIMLTFLPDILPSAFVGILISVIVYAVGGGVLEVLVSPIVEACPSDNKEKTMSLLHSFYCWGQVGVVLLSALFFKLCGINNWRVLALIWAAVPLANAFAFAFAPIPRLDEDGEVGMSLRELLKNKTFWLFFVMMLCAGASEQSVSQWASVFAEKTLGISKVVGDLAGPMAFAVLMGTSRLFYGKLGDKLELDCFMLLSSVLCIISYLLISLCPVPQIGLAACALCGLSVGIMWPGTFSKSSAHLKNGGTAMFSLLALGGDLGCSGGPTLVGFASELFNGDLRSGILVSATFPTLMLFGVILCKKENIRRAKTMQKTR